MSSPAETRVRFEVDDDALTRLRVRIRSYEEHLEAFYTAACGFRRTTAG